METGVGRRDRLVEHDPMVERRLPQDVAVPRIVDRLRGADVRRGLVPLTEQRPADTSIAAYFKWDGLDCCIAVDRYPKVEHNVQAIAKVVEAERAKLRHGGLNVVRAAFRGYAALPPPRDGKPWWDVLGVPQDCSLDAARQAHRTLAVKHHPGAGGDVDRMAEVNRAWDEAQRALAG